MAQPDTAQRRTQAASSWKIFLALLHARNTEFLRDRGALSWSIILPVLIVVACVFAFSQRDSSALTIGLLTPVNENSVQHLTAPSYIATRHYNSLKKGIDQLGYQRIDLLIDTQSRRYWLNDNANISELAERLLLDSSSQKFERLVVSGDRLRYIDWALPGILGMNMMFGSLFGAGYVIVRYRNNGVLKRYQATPITAFQFLAAQVVSRLGIMLTATLAIFIGCQFFLDFVVLGSFTTLLLIATLGALSLVSLGLLLSCRTASEELAGGLLNMMTWPMMLLSEVWFSLEDASPIMQTLSNWLPLTHMVKAARAVMLDGASLPDITHHLLVLLVMTLLFTGLAAYLFRWHKSH